ncbi:starch synthase I, partial [Trifolium pratense]
MESLELLPRLLFLHHHPRASSSSTRLHTTNTRFLPQLGFPSKLKKATKNATLRSISGDTDGGSTASQDGPVSFEDETQQRDEDRALLLSREIDDYGSLVGFRLNSSNSGDFLHQQWIGTSARGFVPLKSVARIQSLTLAYGENSWVRWVVQRIELVELRVKELE